MTTMPAEESRQHPPPPQKRKPTGCIAIIPFI